MLYETIYRKLDRLGAIAAIQSGKDYDKSHIGEPFMDLNMDVLERRADTIVIALSHYFQQNGDLCADPDMEIRIYPERAMAEALTFQQAIPPLYREVYPAPGKVVPELKRELNDFLNLWLNNCLRQGHRFTGAA